MNTFPSITWITTDLEVNDYRPAISADGQQVVFERNFHGNTALPAQLYITSTNSDADPQLFLPATAPVFQQTRPDWCWATNKVVYNIAHFENNILGALSIRIASVEERNSVAVSDSAAMIYPQWNKAGTQLTVMNSNKKSANPQPCTSIINAEGVIEQPNINGTDADDNNMYGGMPAVNPVTGQAAYAGQPLVDNWSPDSTADGYDQDNNYIFLNTCNNNVYSSAPMEAGAPLDQYNSKFQGRAPAWSPDGRYVVFESTRMGGAFALFLFDTKGNSMPVQLTDTVYQSQHAKFFPNGTSLIFCAKPHPDMNNRIAMIDISGYIDDVK